MIIANSVLAVIDVLIHSFSYAYILRTVLLGIKSNLIRDDRHSTIYLACKKWKTISVRQTLKFLFLKWKLIYANCPSAIIWFSFACCAATARVCLQSNYNWSQIGEHTAFSYVRYAYATSDRDSWKCRISVRHPIQFTVAVLQMQLLKIKTISSRVITTNIIFNAWNNDCESHSVYSTIYLCIINRQYMVFIFF